MKQFCFFSGNLEAVVTNEVSKHATAFSRIRISECISRKGAKCRECTSMHNDGEKEQGLSSFYSSMQVMLDRLFYFIR